ncbi:MAG: response regulator, partial [Planctomycetia bacterium]
PPPAPPPPMYEADLYDAPTGDAAPTTASDPVAAEASEKSPHGSWGSWEEILLADPAVPPTEPSPSTPPPDDPYASRDGRPRILVVDDTRTVRKYVQLTLERYGYGVAAAADGEEALAIVARALPDLVLTDINMPGIDGYKLCKILKSSPNTEHIPVVMLSSKDGLFDWIRGKMVGCTEYITKPFEPDVLVQKVQKYIAARP